LSAFTSGEGRQTVTQERTWLGPRDFVGVVVLRACRPVREQGDAGAEGLAVLRVVETTTLGVLFMTSAMPPLCPPKAAANVWYVTRPSSMVSLAAIIEPTACQSAASKYGPVHCSGDSTTPSRVLYKPAVIVLTMHHFLCADLRLVLRPAHWRIAVREQALGAFRSLDCSTSGAAIPRP
jgi:hypothetical protein